VNSARPDGRIAPYLGRVLDGDGDPVGTCFQVAPGIVVTAWHVLQAIEAGNQGSVVTIDSLALGDEPRAAVVERVDELADLAALRAEEPLRGSVRLSGTDGEVLGEPVVVTGVSAVDDPGHSYRYLDALGKMTGGTTRDNAAPLGRMRSQDVVHGMSGAPVRRVSDDVVVGVVSGRYNSADGWLRDSIWLARCEQIAALTFGLAAVDLEETTTSPVELLLTVTKDEVRLQGGGRDVGSDHQGIPSALESLSWEIQRARALARTNGTPAGGKLPELMDRAGTLLGESFLPAPVAEALTGVLSAARKRHQAVSIGLAVEGLPPLPWELLSDPQSGGALALDPLVSFYRCYPGSAPPRLPGPLRILVSISSPEKGGGALLDYERELRNVIAAVRAARQGEAHVRLVPFATTAAIRAELENDPVHVLHLTGHGSPARMVLEDEHGNSREIDAATFVDEAIPPGAMPPIFGLSACYTNAQGASNAPSFASELLARGASGVIATETSLTDVFSTRVFSRAYGYLADSRDPNIVVAACDARRMVQAELEGSTDERELSLATLSEWGAISVLATSSSVVPLDRGSRKPVPPPPPRFNIGAVSARAVGEFVGRRTEQRRWPAELVADRGAGMVLHGIGGVGKTTLAAELISRVIDEEPERAYAVRAGAITADGLLGAAIAALRQKAVVTDQLRGEVATALSAAGRSDLPWSDRLSILRNYVLGRIPLLMVLDNFEDNLVRDEDGAGVRDEILAHLLADLVDEPKATRLLITSRYPFYLPEGRQGRLVFRSVGPLSAAETGKLVWSLPALDRLAPREVERVWRLVGGHPRSLEYVDALLRKGGGRYPDVTDRLRRAVVERLGSDKAQGHLSADWKLDEAMAEVATIAADDVLLDRLFDELGSVADARELLVGMSVYREAVGIDAALFQVGVADERMALRPDREGAVKRIKEILSKANLEDGDMPSLADLPDELQAELAPHIEELNRLPKPAFAPPENLDAAIEAGVASSLLTTSEEGGSMFVHRWTATELARRLSEAGRDAEIVEAHRKAGDYWSWRVQEWPQGMRDDLHDAIEARHHYLEAGEIERADQETAIACGLLRQEGAWDDQEMLIRETIEYLQTGCDSEIDWLGELGAIALNRGELDKARDLFRQVLSSSEKNEISRSIGVTYHSLGQIAEIRGEISEAEKWYRKSLALSEELDEEIGIASNHHQLGSLALARGDSKGAEEEYGVALEIVERLNYLPGISSGLHQFGILARDRDDLDEAERLYRRSLSIEERLSNKPGIASSYHQLGLIAQAREEIKKAEELYSRSLEIEEQLGNLAGMSISYGQIGALAMAQGDLDRAEELFHRALEIEMRIEERPGVAKTLSQLAILAVRRGKPERAIELEVKALLMRLTVAPGELRLNVLRLEKHREILGEERFEATVKSVVDGDSASRVITLLEEWRKTEDPQPPQGGEDPAEK
jgi:tetratricopeptide (TPR) repeat protein